MDCGRRSTLRRPHAHETKQRVYLAGPSDSRRSAERAKPVSCACWPTAVTRIVDPFKLTSQEEVDRIAHLATLDEQRDAWRALNSRIGETNRQAIDSCDSLLAVLDGQDVDRGTAAEIGYAYARGKRIVGYRGDFRFAAGNIGSIVNLQVEYFSIASGGEIVMTTREILLGEFLVAVAGRPPYLEELQPRFP